MSVHITDIDCLDRLEAVEGERWRYSERGADNFHRMRRAYLAFLKALDEEGLEVSEWGDPPTIEIDDEYIEPVLYGKEGYARYLLVADGELFLHAWSTRGERIVIAKDQGFRIIGERNPSRRSRRVLARARRVITSPTGAGLMAAGALGAVGLILWAARRGGAFSLGPRRSPGPGRTAVVGDSIVAHQAGFVRFLNQNVPGRSFTNFGVVGQGTQAILSDLRNRVIGHGFDEVIVEGGANDLGRSNASEYITSRLRTMVREAKAAGLKVVLLPMVPMARAADQIPPINAITMSQGRSWGADVFVDTYQPMNDGRGGIRSDYVSPDGIHPTRDGQLVLGQTILARAYA